jgi:type IV pilus assembly protein PilO
LNQLLDNVLARPLSQKIAILAVAVILLSGLYYTFLFGPRSEAVSKLEESVVSARNERSTKQRQAANLAQLQKELAEMDATLREAMAQLPDREEIPDLLSSISAKAREAGLEILLFRPRAENLREFYAEIPVDIVVRGGFHNVVLFFDNVSKLSRIVNIDNIDFRSPKRIGDQFVLDISSLATTYRFLDEAERKKVAEEKTKAAQAKK